MNFETLEEKIDFLNKAARETLGITYYADWTISSYGDGTPFLCNGSIGNIRASSFKECIDKAFQAVRETMRND